MKAKIMTLFIICALLAGAAFTIMFMRMKSENQTAQTVIAEASLGKQLKESIETERSRCENLISAQSGEFNEYEYCKGYIEWASITLSDSR